ncbi:MAG TPA: transglycosylase domain-containing protein [Ktedonobacterales bacterium]|nr:transglycosylase domain-containing protein [Ktedonobacterales bacterium]
MSRDSRNYDGSYDERGSGGRGGPPRSRRSGGGNDGRGPSNPSMGRQGGSGMNRPPYGPPGGNRSSGTRGGRPPSDPYGHAAGDDYPDQPPRRSRPENRNSPPPGRTRSRGGDPYADAPPPPRARGYRDDEPPPRTRGRSRADDSYEMDAPQAPRSRWRGLGEMAREMSRQLSAIVRGTGRAVQREAAQIAETGNRPPIAPDVLAQVQGDLPRYRRSRIRMRARKWRLSRVRANPVAYAAGLGALVMSLVSILVGGGAGAVYAYNYYDVHRPAIQGIINNAVAGQSTIIYDRNGVPLYTVRNQNGFNYYVPLSQIGKTIQDATLDTEDHSFYSPTNIGVDFQGTLRALVADVTHGGTAQQGGSTITQQLVKNLVLHDTQKAVQRKINEIILAVGVNANYSKQQILEMYLNTIDYGDQNQGIEAAARNYFGLQPKTGKDGKLTMANQQLSIAQAGLLAGLPNAPTYYLPIQYSCEKAPCAVDKWANPCVGDPTKGECVPSGAYDWQKDGHEWLDWRRARVVLGNMWTYGDITEDQYRNALDQVRNMLINHEVKEWAGISNGSAIDTTKRAPSFVDYVIDQLQKQFGVTDLETAGWRVYTTLDYKLDQYMEQNVDYYINKRHTVPTATYSACGSATEVCNDPLSLSANAHDAAAVAIDPHTGDVLGLVGSAKYGDMDPEVGGFNNVAVLPRSLGSSMKGIVYATAFQMGWGPNIMMQDSPICMPGADNPDQDFALVPGCKGQATYVPHNFEGDGYNGYIPLRMALANSLNIPAVEAMQFVGDSPELSTNFITMARRLGLTDEVKDAKGNVITPGLTAHAMGPTTALGTQSVPLIQLTNAYAAMANSGKHVPYRTILRIEDSSGNVWNAPTPHPEQVISPQAAYMLTSVLSDDRARIPGFNHPNPLEFSGMQVASKTGTGSGKEGPSDIVTIGYSPYLAVGAWVGNANNADMRSGIIGIAGAGYIFHDVMDWAIKNYNWPKNATFPIPPDMAMGAFGCNAGLAPYQGEGSGTSGSKTKTSTTSSTGTAPVCSYRDDVASAHHLGIYGDDPGTSPYPDIDWYIKGQEPLLS